MHAEGEDDGALEQEVERRRALVVIERLEQPSERSGSNVEGEPGVVQPERGVPEERGDAEPDAAEHERGDEAPHAAARINAVWRLGTRE